MRACMGVNRVSTEREVKRQQQTIIVEEGERCVTFRASDFKTCVRSMVVARANLDFCLLCVEKHPMATKTIFFLLSLGRAATEFDDDPKKGVDNGLCDPHRARAIWEQNSQELIFTNNFFIHFSLIFSSFVIHVPLQKAHSKYLWISFQ